MGRIANQNNQVANVVTNEDTTSIKLDENETVTITSTPSVADQKPVTLDTIVAGGKYLRNGVWVDANGTLLQVE